MVRFVYKAATANGEVIQGEIEAEDRLMFTSTRRHDPFAGPLEIVVSRVKAQSRSPRPPASLTNTRWRLVSVRDEPVGESAGDEEPFLQLGEADARGFAGCNAFSGGYSREGDELSLGPLAATQRMCARDSELL